MVGSFQFLAAVACWVGFAAAAFAAAAPRLPSCQGLPYAVPGPGLAPEVYSAQGVIVPPTGAFEVEFGAGTWLLGSLPWRVLAVQQCQLVPSFLVELERRQDPFVVFDQRRTGIADQIGHLAVVVAAAVAAAVVVEGRNLIAASQIDWLALYQAGHIGSAAILDEP